MKRALVVALATLLILPLAACDSAASEESLQEAIARAVSKTSEASSYRQAGNMTVCHDGLVGYETYEGECAAPDRFHLSGTWTWENGDSLTASGSVAYQITWTETTVIGETAYRRSSIEPEWGVCELQIGPARPCPSSPAATPRIVPTPFPTASPAPGPPPAPPPATPGSGPSTGPSTPNVLITGGRMGPAEGPPPSSRGASSEGGCTMAVVTLEKSLEFLHYLVDLEELPDEEIDGVTCSHYRGRVDQDAHTDVAEKRYEDECGQVPEEYRELLELTRRQSLTVELWVDEYDYMRLLAVVCRYPVPDFFTGDETWGSSRSTSRFFDFNEAITVEPPEIEAE